MYMFLYHDIYFDKRERKEFEIISVPIKQILCIFLSLDFSILSSL